MTNVNNNAAGAAAESSQAEAGGGKNEPPPPPAPPSPALHAGSKVYRSGPLFLSSKGIGWTSWKKRWFILTQTSLVFYRSDPNVPQKSSEVNLTLGGIDLNSSGSVVVKEDKKLLTVLFPDGRDGRAFTLKAETLEDLHEWKTALEEALSNAPNAALVTGQNGMFKNDQLNAGDASSDQVKDRQTAKSLVIGRPILLALEDIDGTPSFLEKALRFLEEHGVKTEGILRQAADVEDVERRIQEFEKGKVEFSPDEDAHVIADCVKYVLRELPSSPVPASCCKALLEACRTERHMRVAAMRSAICETFPEPNRRLLQRILMMSRTVASHKAVNRMSISAVAACMAPLLLRPLLHGECELDHDFNVGADGSLQLLQAAAAANHAQAIAITLLEEYESIFGDVAVTHEPYTDSEESGTESEEMTDDDDSFEEDDMTETESDMDEDFEHESSRASSETGENKYREKVSGSDSPGSKSPQVDDVLEASQSLTGPRQTSLPQHDAEGTDNAPYTEDANMQSCNSEFLGADPDETSMVSTELSHGRTRSLRRPTVWGRASGKRNLSMESIDLPVEDEAAIQKLESLKTDLQTRISQEAATNSVLQDGLEPRKHELQERRLSLEKEVAGLIQQLQKEIELKKALEAALRISQLPLSVSSLIDDKMKEEMEVVAQAEANVTNLKEKADDLEFQLRQQREQNCRIGQDISNQLNQNANQLKSCRKAHSSSTSENLSRSKSSSDKTGKDRDKKRESSSSLNIPLPQNQQVDAAQNQKANMEGTTRSSSRKSSTKAEGSNSTNALSKLTNRLNFLKERRTQIATELQNLDKGRNAAQNVEHGGESERRHNHHESKGKSSEKSHHSDKARKQEGSPNLERGKSESFPAGEKGPAAKFPPRTFSR
ncbi:Rho GTPase activation protein with PH domain-containing protein [Perilla frutescens var. frutescens]|nr:Rho GTPase activation protein with PH domain-containing protein [Perilla frutescens var. frutescens]